MTGWQRGAGKVWKVGVGEVRESGTGWSGLCVCVCAEPAIPHHTQSLSLPSRTAQSGGERAHEAAGPGAAGGGAGRSGSAIDGRPLDVSGIKVWGDAVGGEGT